MFPLRTLALIVSGILLAGCAVGPDYHRYDNTYETDLNQHAWRKSYP
ncbi:outer membrane factor lipoprotein domain-containing protein [Serratia entomophila]|nr:hypothetical protein [Serratia entomophila]CAI0730726.1 Uncharacterised protein [Serratia entomophila]CAI0731853.1 Uncharacterised protein [Serratia entomophila]CAI0848489.1 Uncharacterised protein [Serratia entomophila]CAI1569472.1 Uncharacterised protein [Serratia entomophila]CAI1577706.1 Uncharacterised protein [Serratia entomophila]